MKIVELFSGIGSQAKALSKIEGDNKVLATCDWDINAVIAYDIIHNGRQLNNSFLDLESNELDGLVRNLNISSDGKKPMTNTAKKRMPKILKATLLYAMQRTNNFLDITKVKGKDLPEEIDLLTYSFPCQDLSIAGYWHYNEGGIDRNSGNRSSLLWEVERILNERNVSGEALPKFLLMENVNAILSSRHSENFDELKSNLDGLGYVNKVFTLNTFDFGLPQRRVRTYMLSVLTSNVSTKNKRIIEDFLEMLNDNNLHDFFPREKTKLVDVLKLDYSNTVYRFEAEYSSPNRTESRQFIFENNQIINTESEFVKTLTTKQDRHPNSGIIEYEPLDHKKMQYRNLTPRECFLLMGFEEEDFNRLLDNDFNTKSNQRFFARDKLVKMAGNSIGVNVLQSLFELIREVNRMMNE